MNGTGESGAARVHAWPETLRLFLGLSRTPHGVLDMATPAMAALILLDTFPPVSTMVIGVVTAFAGYTSVYALNDLVDVYVDRERLGTSNGPGGPLRVDEVMVRHPVARGLLSFRDALLWCMGWALIALLGAWLLNPFCALIFLVSACLEAVYCRLLKITHLRIVPSAIVKASGGIAGVFAVDPNPSPAFVMFLLLWLAAWEIGGQNIPNDLIDMEDDLRVSARTVPTVRGMADSVFIMVSAVSMAAFAGVAIYWYGSGRASHIGFLYPIGAAIIGWFLLLAPAREVYRNPGAASAAVLFNKASYMPLALLALISLTHLLKL
jgi:4-hydroxybenzoate polyprenyltransferase